MIGPEPSTATIAPSSRDAFHSIAILDRSPFRRSCIAASLASFASAEILLSNTTEELFGEDGAVPALILVPLGADEERLVLLKTELTEIRMRGAEAKIVIIADDPEHLMHDGADVLSLSSVVVPASIDVELLAASLRLARLGFRIMPEGADKLIVQGMLKSSRDHAPNRQDIKDHPLLANCTARQRDVIDHIARGLPNREIARQLAISESTVKAHIRTIMDLLDVSNRTQIVSKLNFLGG